MRKKLDDPFKVWRRWFAWYPIEVGDTLVWWEWVERRWRMSGWEAIWEYRLVED